MTIKARAIFGAVLIATLSLAGLAAASSVMQHHQNAAMMDRSDTTCVAQCLKAGSIPSPVPLVPIAALLTVALLAVAVLVSLPQLSRVVMAAHEALARPSPNFITLYAHYLD